MRIISKHQNETEDTATKEAITDKELGLYVARTSFIIMATILFIIFQTGCKKLVEVDAPFTSTNAANVYATDATAIAVVTGMYTKMSAGVFENGGVTSVSLFSGLSADELTLYSGVTNNAVNYYYTNALTKVNLNNPDFWTALYQTIFVANSAIEGLANSAEVTPAVKQQLIGEAKFMRAFCYFYLVNLYGNVPLVTTTDYKINSLLSRLPNAQVYQQIIADLTDAQNLLNSDYLDATLLNITTERIRPTKWAATALLARVYLYTGDWVKAEVQATAVINNTATYKLANDLNSVFLANSEEAIWQLQPVKNGQNTPEAWLFIIPETGPNNSSHPIYLSTNLVSSFETGDQRKANWINSVTVSGTTYYYPYKYKSATLNSSVTEYSMIFRLVEQFLIRAEARAQEGNISEASSDLNIVRTRAGLSNITASTKETLLTTIIHERQVELFTEWGHRWVDLKRTGTINAVMSVVTLQKGGTWSSNWQLYPIPLSELQRNPNLVQNQGY